MQKLSTTPITVEFAEETLKDLISPDTRREITPELIINIVSEHFNIRPEYILSQKRTANIVYPRQIAMYLCHQMTTAKCSHLANRLVTGTIQL